MFASSVIGLKINYRMGLVMRKPAFCICENKDTDQLRGNREADQRLCFCYIDSTIHFLTKSEIFCGCTAWFVSDLVRNPKDRFSHNEAHLSVSGERMGRDYCKLPQRGLPKISMVR